MPFQSEKQRRYLHANHPEIAKRWERDYAGGGITRLGLKTGTHPSESYGTTISHTPQDRRHPSEKYGTTISHTPKPPVRDIKVTGDEKKLSIQQQDEADKDERRRQKRIKYMLDRRAKGKGYSQKNLQRLTTGYGTNRPGFYGNVPTYDPLATRNVGIRAIDNISESLLLPQIKPDMTPDYSGVGTTHPFSMNRGTTLPGTIRPEWATGITTLGPVEPGSEDHPRRVKKSLTEELSTKDYIPDGPSMDVDTGQWYNAKGEPIDDPVTQDGGILDINESEEIIDDGNDIELTAYNAAFDEPTGVKSLFQAKDGGRIGFAKGDWSPGVAAEERESRQEAREAMRGPIGRPTTETKTVERDDGGDNYQDRIIELADRQRKQNLKDTIARGDEEKYDTQLQKIQEKWSGTYQGTLKKQKAFEDYSRDKWEQVRDSTNEKLKKKVGGKLVQFALSSGITFGLKDFIDVMVSGYKQGKAKNEFIAVLNDSIEKYRDLGIPEHSPHTDTLIQKLNQEILDLTQTRDTPDEDPGGDGPIYAPLTGAVDESYAQGYYNYGMSDLDRIRAGQAKRAMINPEWQEPWGANSGGLANLFRVKNQ